MNLNVFKPFKSFKTFKLPPLFLPRDAGEDEGEGLNPSAALRTGSAKRLNGLNDFNV
jgi:hypothetical protein